MYVFWHTAFSLALGIALWFWLRPNSWIKLLAATTLGGIFPDLDHLLTWRDVYWARIFPSWAGVQLIPRAYSDILAGLLVFHIAILPFIVLVLAAIAARHTKHQERWVLVGAFCAGWILHLFLDGVFLG